MMFAMVEHAVGEKVDEAAAWDAGTTLVVGVYSQSWWTGPDREVTGEAFADELSVEMEREGGKCGGEVQTKNNNRARAVSFMAIPDERSSA